jgi:hypothetical protein
MEQSGASIGSALALSASYVTTSNTTIAGSATLSPTIRPTDHTTRSYNHLSDYELWAVPTPYYPSRGRGPRSSNGTRPVPAVTEWSYRRRQNGLTPPPLGADHGYQRHSHGRRNRQPRRKRLPEGRHRWLQTKVRNEQSSGIERVSWPTWPSGQNY